MLAKPLPTIEINPSIAPRAVVIWLHGLGADGHDFAPIVSQLGLPSNHAVRFVFPHAPEMPIGLFGGQVVRAWFDFQPGRSDFPGLSKSVLRVRDLIQVEIDNGVPASCIVLAGFSQGGALALQTALHYPKRMAGIMALSTFLAESSSDLGSDRTKANQKTPILMCHGQRDPVLPVTMGRVAHDTLKRLGYDVEWHEYPMGHEVCLHEIQEITRWLRRIFPEATAT